MTSLIPFNRRLLVGIAAAAAAALSLLQVAQAGPQPPVVPGQIQVETGNKVFLVGHGVGVQIYTCDGSVWSAAVPRANLFGDNGKLIITHFAGPSWQAKDGSKVVGHLVNKVTVDPTAIPWLLLSATTTPGADGDRLVDTTFVQRINTTGGLTPPAADCNAATAGTVVEVPYTADYIFWKKTGA
jgi:FtsP/CotA-like multicopper oxidase with cupredoxin domain